MVDELHHFSAGIKNTATTYSYFGIDELRQACGGAGFLLSSKIADIWSDWSPTVTFEGTNVVMAQQSARYVLKQVKKVTKGGKA
jgi:acyl-CoA oxidase